LSAPASFFSLEALQHVPYPPPGLSDERLFRHSLHPTPLDGFSPFRCFRRTYDHPNLELRRLPQLPASFTHLPKRVYTPDGAIHVVAILFTQHPVYDGFLFPEGVPFPLQMDRPFSLRRFDSPQLLACTARSPFHSGFVLLSWEEFVSPLFFQQNFLFLIRDTISYCSKPPESHSSLKPHSLM